MSHELICSALGVSPDRWPPDHYTLLGLAAGEVNPAAVEERVLDRMERLRRYQLAQPDAVTDGMNRLAQALVCLTDPAAKAAYDASLRQAAKSVTPATRVEIETFTAYPLAPAEPRAAAPAVPRPPPRPRRDEPRRRLYHRLAVTRRLLLAWRAVGQYVADPLRWPLRPIEGIDFVEAILELRERLADETLGRPGAEVAALSRQPLPLTTFRHLKPEQQAELAADWQAGLERLIAIHAETAAAVRRQRGTAVRTLRKVARSLLADRLDLALIVLGLAALGLAICRIR